MTTELARLDDDGAVESPEVPVRPQLQLGGRYQAVQLLKEGLGSQTLLATDNELGQTVVIKTLRSDVVPDGMQMRLEQECRQLCELHNLEHPPLLDIGREGNLLYLVMPYVQGISLDAYLRNGPLGIRETLSLGICLLHALRELHVRRILHRNIKPGNVIIDDRPSMLRATLIDIGLAHTVLPAFFPTDRRPKRPSTRRRNRPGRWTSTWPNRRTCIRPASCCTSAWRAHAVLGRHGREAAV